MKNKLTILSIGIFTILCVTRSYSTEAIAETSMSDLQNAEKGVHRLEGKLQKREYDLKKRAEYEKVQTTEMKKCDELKSEIWKLKDSAKALDVKLAKLASDKKKAEEELVGQTKIYEAREKGIKTTEDEISAEDKQFKRLAEAGEKESSERKTRIDKLKEGLKSPEDKIESLTNEKNKIDENLKAKDTEYKAETDKLKALRARLASEKKEGASVKKGASAKEEPPVKDESEEIKKKMDDLMVEAQKLESARQKLSDELLTANEAKRSQEEEVKALENEDVSKAKDLKSRSGDLGKKKKATQVKVEKLRKKAISAKFKVQADTAAVKKLDDDIKLATQEKHRIEKALKEKTDELKVRVSVLLEHNTEDSLAYESDKEAQAKAASRGEELSARLDKIFEAMKDENNRLMVENKEMQARLGRAENAAREARRKAEAAAKAPEEMKVKLNKERLDAHFNTAVMYEKNGLWHDAEREYLKCLRIDPKDAGVHYNLGILYDDKLNMNNKALYHYYKFLSLRPMGETAERVRDWITKMELENRLGKELR
ncbi:MAG: tetratricopeptide repeat protein [Candidatus Omnitrophica bacterium]|nr:tetratricopeptide repeat protein [Candidatus Omnitrophota bacterium]